jgi:hypothetical protein
MLRYKINANPHALRLIRLTRYGIPVSFYSPIDFEKTEEIILEPEFWYSVWDCKVSLIALFYKNDLSQIQITYPELPNYVYELAVRDLARQGGAINISGIYHVLSSKIFKFIESKKFQKWLENEAQKRGIEIVKNEKEEVHHE